MSFAARCAGLPRPLRQLVALFAVPLMIALILAVIVLPLLSLWGSQTAWRDDARRILVEAKQIPRITEQLEQQRAIVEASDLWSHLYVRSGSVSSATTLHGDVSALLAQAGANAQSLSPIPARELNFFSQLGIRCTASMRMDQLQQFMDSLGRHSRYLRIDRLVVAASQSQSPQENPPLAVTMDIVGFERDMAQADASSRSAKGGS